MGFDVPLFLASKSEMDERILLFLLFDLVIIILAARLMGAAVKKVGQPSVIGEILAGIVLGPTILGRFSKEFFDNDWSADLFPADVPLKPIANLGLVFFMFLVGLELDQKLIQSQGRRALQISLSGVLAPLALGMAVGFALYSTNNGGVFLDAEQPRVDRWVFALFLGSAMCITAFPVLARILVETGLYKTAVGTATLCAGAVDDVIAWLLLAVVVGVVKEGDPISAAPAIILTAVFVVFMFLVVRRGLDLLARRYDEKGHLTVDMVAIILAGVLLSAWATEEIGIHAIFGAFIFGAIMPKRSGMTRELTDKVEDFTLIVLLPIFFLVAGLRTNLFTLNSPALIGWLLLILGAAVIGKFVGCGLAAKMTGSNWRDSVVVGSLMNTRGLTELVILGIGLELGVLSDVTFAMMVIMALVTTVMAAPIVNRLMPREQILREISDGEAVPVAPVAARVLVAVGNMENAPGLVDAGVRLLGNQRPAEVLLVRLIATSRASEFRTGLQDEDLEIERSVEGMQRLVEQASASGVIARTLSFLSDDIGGDLARIAREQQCTALVMGWHRPNLPRDTVRALARRLFRLAPCDVFVYIDRRGEGIKIASEQQVLAVLSGGPHDDAAIAAASGLAASLNQQVKVVGYIGTHAATTARGDSEKLALAADSIHRTSGQFAVPDYRQGDASAVARDEAAIANIAVIGVGEDWPTDAEFGAAISAIAEDIICPLLVVRAAGKGTDAPAPVVEQSDWPFVTPRADRKGDAPKLDLPPVPHLQRLDPFGRPFAALPLGEEFSIGRNPDNTLTLSDDNLVSRRHAVVVPEGDSGGFELKDRGSTNGTLLWRDGRWQAIEERGLEDGDILVIGANVLRYSRGGPVAPPI